ncbi:NAD(P)H-dependent oxidoreductase [Cytobacillus suaedae]|nr:NAD(P)H-dependent oxidoreductase [Cytobacillus suaedae]
MKVYVLHASMNGTTKILGEAVAEGAKQVKGSEVVFQSVEEVDITKLKEADAIIWGSPGIFANISPKMSEFLFKLGGVWFNGELRGKVGGVFATTSNTHWGIENVLRNLQLPMQAFGMQIISHQPNPEHYDISTPYGASAICKATLDPNEMKKPSEAELENARNYGRLVATAALNQLVHT